MAVHNTSAKAALQAPRAAPVLLHVGHALHGRVQLLRPGCQLRRLRVPQPRTPQRLPSPRSNPIKTCPARPTRRAKVGCCAACAFLSPSRGYACPAPGFFGLSLSCQTQRGRLLRCARPLAPPATAPAKRVNPIKTCSYMVRPLLEGCCVVDVFPERRTSQRLLGRAQLL